LLPGRLYTCTCILNADGEAICRSQLHDFSPLSRQAMRASPQNQTLSPVTVYGLCRTTLIFSA
jgi:hypothetical protein